MCKAARILSGQTSTATIETSVPLVIGAPCGLASVCGLLVSVRRFAFLQIGGSCPQQTTHFQRGGGSGVALSPGTKQKPPARFMVGFAHNASMWFGAAMAPCH